MQWGMGHWRWTYPPYTPYGWYGVYGPSPDQEKQMLLNWKKWYEDQKDLLDSQLKQVEKRLSELEKPEK